MRACAYGPCTKDLDALGKRPDARFCSSDHKDRQRRIDAQRESEEAAKRNRKTRGLTLSLPRATAAVREGYLLAVSDFKDHSRISTVDTDIVAIERAAERIAASHLTPKAREEYDRRKAAK